MNEIADIRDRNDDFKPALVFRITIGLCINRIIMIARISRINRDQGRLAQIRSVFQIRKLCLFGFFDNRIRKFGADVVIGKGDCGVCERIIDVTGNRFDPG